jgi:hypothetical protein
MLAVQHMSAQQAAAVLWSLANRQDVLAHFTHKAAENQIVFLELKPDFESAASHFRDHPITAWLVPICCWLEASFRGPLSYCVVLINAICAFALSSMASMQSCVASQEEATTPPMMM